MNALIDYLMPLAVGDEQKVLQLYRSGQVHPVVVRDALRRLVGCFVSVDASGRIMGGFPPPRRSDDAPAVSDEQRAEIVRLAKEAGVL